MNTKLEKRKRSSKCIKDQIFKSFQESLHEIHTQMQILHSAKFEASLPVKEIFENKFYL